ncbi:MAG TPA: hypothetical protein VKH64_03875 [Candidatus Binatia bacterium]|nr:hypothetical protein [Candidatus Binatia bacterium]
MGEEFSGSKYIQLHGTAEIITLPEAMDLLVYLAPLGARRASRLARAK